VIPLAEPTTASGDTPNPPASGSDGLQRPAIDGAKGVGSRCGCKQGGIQVGDEGARRAQGWVGARIGSRPAALARSSLKADAVEKQRMSLEAREEQKAIELVAAQLRRDAEAAHRASQAAQAPVHTFDTDRSDCFKRGRFEFESW
jgi:hypothetical protein